MENAKSFPIEKDDNKSHTIIDVPGAIKENITSAMQLWQKSRPKLKIKAQSRSLGMCLIIITTRICFMTCGN